MKKNLKKITNVLIVMMLMTIMFFNLSSYAATAAPDPGKMTGTPDVEVDKITNIGNQVITIISTVGSIGAVIVLIVLGIKYMMGSAEEKSEYKKTLMPYVIGAVFVFAASAIAGIIFNMAETFTK